MSATLSLARLNRRHHVLLVAGLLLAVLAGCSAGVNQELLETPTVPPSRTMTDPAGAGATPDPAVAAALATARSALRRGDVVKALETLDPVVVAHPGAVDALTLRAEARRQALDLEGAAADLATAAALAPDQMDIVLARARLAAQQADFALANDLFTRVIRRAPGNPDAYVGRALTAIDQAHGDPGRYEAALADLNRAIALDAVHLTALLGRARLYLDRAAFRGAPDDLDRALTALNELPRGGASEAATLLRARVLAAMGDADAAKDVLDRPTIAARGDPPVTEADRAAAGAAVASAREDWDAAAAEAAAAIAADPSHWAAYMALAEAELARGDAAAALRASDRLLRRWPGNGPALFYRGLALLAAGDEDEAMRALTLAREELAASPVYRARIAQTLQPIERGGAVASPRPPASP